jgi:hypothetical protein
MQALEGLVEMKRPQKRSILNKVIINVQLLSIHHLPNGNG